MDGEPHTSQIFASDFSRRSWKQKRSGRQTLIARFTERDARGPGKQIERRIARTTHYPDLFLGHFKIPEKTQAQDPAASKYEGLLDGDDVGVWWAGDGVDHEHGDSPPEVGGRERTQT